MPENSLKTAREQINKIDREMAELFVKRMRAVETVAEYKKENQIHILDEKRECEIIERNSAYVDDPALREYYIDFLRNNMALSKVYQSRIIGEENLPRGITRISSTITLGHGALSIADKLFDLGRRVVIITDSGVPTEYVSRLKELCKDAEVITVAEGEGSKSLEVYSEILAKMLSLGITRSDCVVALGGGVIGDLAGFVASSYMRRIDFYNIPTTLLSQVDSSIGGKTAVNLSGTKNIVGTFYQPKGVIIDPDLLKTLPERHISNGLSEVVKMALCYDAELFALLEKHNLGEEIPVEIIARALLIKKRVVDSDEKENGERRVLNFGHTLGHGIEAAEGGRLLHGECVAIGMTVVSSAEVKKSLIPLLKKFNLPTEYHGNLDSVLSYVNHDKKRLNEELYTVLCDRIGSYRIEKMTVADFCDRAIGELNR